MPSQARCSVRVLGGRLYPPDGAAPPAAQAPTAKRLGYDDARRRNELPPHRAGRPKPRRACRAGDGAHRIVHPPCAWEDLPQRPRARPLGPFVEGSSLTRIVVSRNHHACSARPGQCPFLDPAMTWCLGRGVSPQGGCRTRCRSAGQEVGGTARWRGSRSPCKAAWSAAASSRARSWLDTPCIMK